MMLFFRKIVPPINTTMPKNIILKSLCLLCAISFAQTGIAQYKKASKSLTWGAQGKLWFFAPGFDEPVVGGGVGFNMDFHEKILFSVDANYYSTYVDSITRYAQPKVNDKVDEARVRIGRNQGLIELTGDFKFFPAHTIFDDFGFFLSTGVTFAYVNIENDIRPFNSVEYELSPSITDAESVFGVYFNPGVGFQFKLGQLGIILQGGYGLLGMEFGDTTTDFKLPQNLHASLGFRYVPGKKSFIRR